MRPRTPIEALRKLAWSHYGMAAMYANEFRECTRAGDNRNAWTSSCYARAWAEAGDEAIHEAEMLELCGSNETAIIVTAKTEQNMTAWIQWLTRYGASEPGC